MRFLSLLAVLAAVLGCALWFGIPFDKKKEPDGGGRFRSLKAIVASGYVRVLTLNNPYCYYNYRDEEKGFEFDLATAFAKSLGVALKVQISKSPDALIADLLEGKGDFIAGNLTVTPWNRHQVGFSDGYLPVRHQIVVHRENRHILSARDLEGRVVHVGRQSAQEASLDALRSNGIDVGVVPLAGVTLDELIAQVQEKKIEVTIADDHMALLSRRYHPRAMVTGAVSRWDHYRWAFPVPSSALGDNINRFLDEAKKSGLLSSIYSRYFRDLGMFDYLDIRKFHLRIRTRLPRYRQWIEEIAALNGLDWRLVAAQMYQESHIEPEAISPDGAYGLMQITPATADCFGVLNLLDPKENIRAGVSHLKTLYDLYDKAGDPDRLHIALAAYNVGQGHVKDARDMARSRNLDPDKWQTLADMLLLLEVPEHFEDTVYGYCRGSEPVDYVRQVNVYYDILRRRGLRFQAG